MTSGDTQPRSEPFLDPSSPRGSGGAAQLAGPFPSESHLVLDRLVAPQVGKGGLEEGGVVVEIAEGVVAAEAEDPAELTRFVVVVEMEADIWPRLAPTNGTTPALAR